VPDPLAETRSAPGRVVAGVDLGSNSFHMIVARLVGEELFVLDRLRERVALAEGLGDDRRISPEARERALACLSRFGQRLAEVHPDSVRAVGTNALREARDAASFLEEAEARLGHPIEVIAGIEEARLIYLGVAHDVSDDLGRRLIVDVGGGSTELVIGERFEPLRADSLRMGCVSFSQRFFPGGEIKDRGMERARIAALLELQTIQQVYPELGWDECFGSSGTVLAIDGILNAAGWNGAGITAKGLRKLRKVLVAAGHVERLDLPGLQEERRPVLAGGLAILSAVFEALGVRRMRAAQGALREGLLYDLVGRIRHEDVRDRTIRALCERNRVDLAQARRVERTALALLAQVEQGWELEGEEAKHLLQWAARLHEIGLSIAYSRHQKHGAYLVENADLPGFSREDQRLLATIIEAHRRKLPRQRLDALRGRTRRVARRLCVLLRLAVLLNRSRSRAALPPIAASARKDRLELAFPEAWLEAHPLTRADLELEQALLAAEQIELSFA
jgi:exopolyphosphatase/guanosine-5'-triphosphate,3'-diphosphate pyrophosphatase